MPHGMFFVVDENPNDVTGGGGDVCDVMKQPDCHGPYVVFPATDMENVASPSTVICAACLRLAYDAVYGAHAETISGGEHTGHTPKASRVERTPAAHRRSKVIDLDHVALRAGESASE